MYIHRGDIIIVGDIEIKILWLDGANTCYVVEIEGVRQNISYFDDIWNNITKIKRAE